MADVSVKIKDLKLKNPEMTASGTFGYGLEFADFGTAVTVLQHNAEFLPREDAKELSVGKTPLVFVTFLTCL